VEQVQPRVQVQAQGTETDDSAAAPHPSVEVNTKTVVVEETTNGRQWKVGSPEEPQGHTSHRVEQAQRRSPPAPKR
jgi:hypothetical protein